MVDGKLLVEKLIRYSLKFLYLNPRDEIYYRNLLLREFKLAEPSNSSESLDYIETLDVPDILVEEIEKFAKEQKLCQEGEEQFYSTYILGILTPLPSKVNEQFIKIKESKGINQACEYFYELCVKNNYIQKTAVGKNLKWEFVDGDKFLEITINLSKPENDNKDLVKQLHAPKKTKYPACLLCKENEGFAGGQSHPARENIRTISLKLGGEPWFVQYSPYAYYNEHMIAISEEHTPMHIEDDTIDKLLDFVDFFPNYMMGSNASLPIIGGSILNHEHFQGGEHVMPMHKAPLSKIMWGYKSKQFKKVKVGVVDWYNSVIRLESSSRKDIANFAKHIVKAWANYSDELCGIKAQTEAGKHNSLAPVCRKSGKNYIFDLILRSNLTSDEYPDGVFHAHPEYHNIKKESIGLIESMGLFVLPGRLKRQLNIIAEILCGAIPYRPEEIAKEDNDLFVHKNMIASLMNGGVVKDMATAQEKVRNYVNIACKNILDNTAVFKKDEQGLKGFDRFLESVGVKRDIQF